MANFQKAIWCFETSTILSSFAYVIQRRFYEKLVSHQTPCTRLQASTPSPTPTPPHHPYSLKINVFFQNQKQFINEKCGRKKRQKFIIYHIFLSFFLSFKFFFSASPTPQFFIVYSLTVPEYNLVTYINLCTLFFFFLACFLLLLLLPLL